jgi:alkylation response protein AidB-like acyl-CoA dehydrogenase
MIDPLLREQFARTLDDLPQADPWPALANSGFLDLLAPNDRGGAALSLDALFEIAIETARRPNPPPIVETILARLRNADAIAIDDAEMSLTETGMAPPLARGLAAAAAAAQMTGAMQALLEMTVDYAGTRQQFGRPIGKFQAVQQQLAVAVEEVHAATVAAQIALVGEPDQIDRSRVAVAKIRAGQAAQILSATAHAVHGAVGISAEHQLHHYTRRLHEWRMAHGGESWWAGQLGQTAINGGGDFITAIRRLSTPTASAF